MTARWLVTGAGGMLGREMITALAAAGQQVAGLARHSSTSPTARGCGRPWRPGRTSW